MRGITGASICASLTILLLFGAPAASGQLNTVNYLTLPTNFRGATSITAGPDGALWFGDGYSGSIGRIDLAWNVSQYVIPYPYADPNSITAGPDGNLWFTDYSNNSIGRVCVKVLLPTCPTVGHIHEWPVKTADSQLTAITAGPDTGGVLWFTEFNANNIGRITINGTVTEYKVPTAGAGPYAITAGPDGALWFTEFNSSRIGRITTTGSSTDYPVTAGSYPSGITAGPDGALWFAESGAFFGEAAQIGRITTGTNPVVSEFAVNLGDNLPEGPITAGADRALWFLGGSQFNPYYLNQTTTGLAIGFALPIYVNGIASGPDGAIWTEGYAGESGGQIGQAIPSSRRNGIDLSVFSAVPTSSMLTQFQQTGVQYAVVEGSQSGSSVPLQQLTALSGAHFKTAAYCFLYFEQSTGSGSQQAQNCFDSISGALSNLSFVAVDVEVTPGQTPVCPSNGPWVACIQIINDAIQTLTSNGVSRIVVYTNQGYWNRLTGGDATDFSSYPLWNAAHGSFTGYTDPAGNLSCAPISNMQSRIKALLPTPHGGTGLPNLELPTPITAFSVTSDVVTVTAANTFTPGQQVSVSGLTTGTFLNGKTLTVLAAGLSNSQFTAKLMHKNVAQTSDSGTATLVLFGGWQVQAGTQYDIGANGGACLFGESVDFDVFDPSLFD